jgi:hypothetical protein
MKLITEVQEGPLKVEFLDEDGKVLSNPRNNGIDAVSLGDIPITPGKIGRSTNSVHISGIFAQADILNRNNRVYPLGVLQKAIASYSEDYVQKKRALGELNHPPEPTVNPERACIIIESLEFRGNDVWGKAKVLNTPLGNIVQQLLADNVKLGVSTRGLGSLKPLGGEVYEVEDDYSIQAIDVVHAPSGVDCFVNGVLESLDFYIKNGVIKAREAEKFTKNKKDFKKVKEDMEIFFHRLNNRL